MRTEDFDYFLPPELIAQSPVEPRDASRLMVLHRDTGRWEHRLFRDLPEYLRPGDVLVANESRVIPARLYGRKIPTGGKVELLLVSKLDEWTWRALVRGHRIREGTKLGFPASGGFKLVGEVIKVEESGERVVRFREEVEPLLEDIGVVPLPPYIRRPLADAERYQTVYARVSGSVAAPTAGLHFTHGLIRRLQERGVRFAFVTLHIGPATFRPVRTERIEDHVMHSEYCELSEETAELLNEVREEGRRIVAIGTTTVRVLETAALRAGGEGPARLEPFSGWTDLFIYPGFRFRVVDALITNFHLPRSTLLMLVSAFAGRELVLRAYQEAIRQRYRFYSFGDAMLIL